jgi:tRNA threonylcarbamoyladenosine biosynthesis protein TsaB
LAETTEPRAHSAQLTTMIQSALNQAHKVLSDLVAVVVSSGPGSYTGIRIGVSTAKGLCFVTGIPLIAINTLVATAHAIREPGRNVLVGHHARLDEYFVGYFDDNLNALLPSGVMHSDEVARILKEDASVKISSLLGVSLDPSSAGLVDHRLSAIHLVELGFQRWQASLFESLAQFQPDYLRSFPLA